MSASRLLLDAGNSRLKWAVLARGLWLAQGSADYSDLSPLVAHLDTGIDCYIASVASTQQEYLIRSVLASFDINPKWLKATSEFKNVSNGYANPQQLGVDRWMGLIAARERTQEPALVVSVGTAMTVDALSEKGAFLGGLIVPGRALMQQSLRQGTARVADAAGTWQAFPRTTADAVQSGIVAALCGAIEVQRARLAEQSGQLPQCLLTGGDALMLLPHFSGSAEHVPALVLEGIACVAREEEAR